MPLPSTLPTFVPRLDFLDYLHRYADDSGCDRTGVEVMSAARDTGSGYSNGGGPSIQPSPRRRYGSVANPYVPAIAGRDSSGAPAKA